MSKINIEINGVVETNLSEEDFQDKFLEFIENNSCIFGGRINERQ